MDTGGQPDARLIDGRFELLQRLGGGGMGLVWRARDIVLQREVALKEVRPADPAMAAADPTSAAEMRERVLREARALARLQHPNVVVIHHIVDSVDYPHPWLVMELVTGGSLGDRLERGPLSEPEAARIGRGLLSALRAAHTAGIMHRDVKPGNVLLRPDGTPVLTDFGIAALSDATALTRTGSLVGSPEYIAPERIRGQEGDPSSDLWSLGMLLYVAVEGTHPLRRGTALATLAAVLDEPLPPPARAGRLGPLLTALLAKEPGARPDADQVDRALADAELGASAWAPPADRVPGGGSTHLLSGPSDALPGTRSGTPADRVPDGFPGPIPARPGTPPFGVNPPGTSRYGAMPLGAVQLGTVAQPVPVGRTGLRRRAPLLVAVCTAVLAVCGSVVWGSLAADGGHATGSGVATGGSGPVLAPSGSPSTGTPSAGSTAGTSGAATGAASVDLLTPDGLRRAVAAMRPMIPGGKVFELTVYPGYAIAEVPTAPGAQEYDEVDYRDGRATRSTGGPAVDEKPVDLGSYDWNVIPAVLRKAQAMLKVPHPDSRYLIIEADIFDRTPVIAVYFSDANSGSAYLTANTKGTVQRTYPLGS